MDLLAEQPTLLDLPLLLAMYPRREERPEVFRELEEQLGKAKAFLDGAVLKGWVPRVREGITRDPRVSRFGGPVPFRSGERAPECPDCHRRTANVCSLYTGDMPERFGLPDDALLVATFCLACEQQYPCAVYVDLDELEWEDEEQVDGTVFNEPRVVVGWESVNDVPEVKWLGKKDLGLELPNTKWPLSDLCQFLQGGPGALGTPYRERAVDTVLGPVYPLFWKKRRRPEGAVLVMRFLHSKASTSRWGDFGGAHLWLQPDGRLSLDWVPY